MLEGERKRRPNPYADAPRLPEGALAEMRRILAQGLYSADPMAIAGRLLQLEHSLKP